MNSTAHPVDLDLYRPCVGVMLFNRDGRVWIGRRSDKDNDEGSGLWWQMPQGGIDDDEDPAAAALRELYEETSVRSAAIVEEAPGWYVYDLPERLIGRAWGGRWRGQKQRWFALRFSGDKSEIDILHPGGGHHKAEFDSWRWARLGELADIIVPFKRQVYTQVIDAFRHLEG